MTHPYSDLPARAFWQSAIARADRAQFAGLYQPRVAIRTDTAVATAGSCFAQHIATYLRMAGCNVLDAEPPLAVMNAEIAKRFGYGLFSARYGNIYTARQMCELLEDVNTGQVDATHVWAKGDRFVDALRPMIEPDGLDSLQEVLLHRTHHLHRIADMLEKTDVFIFTLGLTECWQHSKSGRTYPVCPGVAGGTFDATLHRFHNFTHAQVLADLHRLHALLRGFNPQMALILTVSPVPLTATATNAHVLSATSTSKAILLAAAQEFIGATDMTDYVPSYEIITAPASGGPWFEANMRSVSQAGVEKVMRIVLSAHGLIEASPPDDPAPLPDDDAGDDLVCEDLLLQSFAK